MGYVVGDHPMETELTIEGGGLPPFSARGCHQMLMPIRNGEYRRTIDGKLVFLGNETHHKYRTRIRGQDKTSPTIEKWWQGRQLSVGCLQRLCQEFLGDGLEKRITLARRAIENSVLVFDEARQNIAVLKNHANELELEEAPPQGKRLFISYRPFLEMMMTHHTIETDEWGHQVGWMIELEEL